MKSTEYGNNKASSEIISNHFATCVQKCRDVCHISVLRLFCSILKIIGWLLKANLFQSIKICLNTTIVHIFDEQKSIFSLEAKESLHFIILAIHIGKVIFKKTFSSFWSYTTLSEKYVQMSLLDKMVFSHSRDKLFNLDIFVVT